MELNTAAHPDLARFAELRDIEQLEEQARRGGAAIRTKNAANELT